MPESKEAPKTASQMLTEEDVAARLQVRPATVRGWRVTGDGPVYHKIGRAVRYTEEELADYIAGTARTSTSAKIEEVRR